MNSTEIPGYKIVEDKIEDINNKIVIEDIIYDVGHMVYRFKLSNNDRKCDAIFDEQGKGVRKGVRVN